MGGEQWAVQRIRDQCPEQCATVQCGSEFIHNLFSTDGARKPISAARDGNANLGHGASSPDMPETVEKPDESPPVPSFSFQTANSNGDASWSLPPSNSGDARVGGQTTTMASSGGFPTLIPFSSESNLWSTVTQQQTNLPLAPAPAPAPAPTPISEIPQAPRRDGHRRRTTPDPRIIRPPESLVVIGDYDEDEPPSENAVVDSPLPIPIPTTTPAPVISNSGDVFARSRKEISSVPDVEPSGTASALSGSSSHEWKVSIIPRGQNKQPNVNSIPPFTIDGKSDERFNKFYRTIDKVINKLELTPGGGLQVREGEPQIRLEGSTKDLSAVDSSAVVIVSRTTVAPGTTNKVSVIPFRPLHFTAPPAASPPRAPATSGQCGVAPDFTPCVSNDIASKSLLECCQRKKLPPGCQQLCRYDITQTEIRAAMDRGQCGIFNVAPFLECASQGKDNSECCRHRGIVQKTGPQCEQFCRPTQGLSALGVQHIVCGNAVGDMLHCHHSGVRV
ncbi:unnamed protein product [Caenorhabditis sp. 36 PRJEB53466]|nr:unnamed protein product [Caenorhabditis sp. 36 PRJEB53466]